MRLVLDLDLVTAADLCTALRKAIDKEVARTAPKKQRGPKMAVDRDGRPMVPTTPKRKAYLARRARERRARQKAEKLAKGGV